MDQSFYLKKLECLELTSFFTQFRSMLMKLAWLPNTRLNLQFEISQLAQVTEQRFKKDATAHLKRLNNAIGYAHRNVAHLPFAKIGMDSARIVRYSDAAFANNHGLTSQIGRIILLVYDSDTAIQKSLKSYKYW